MEPKKINETKKIVKEEEQHPLVESISTNEQQILRRQTEMKNLFNKLLQAKTREEVSDLSRGIVGLQFSVIKLWNKEED